MAIPYTTASSQFLYGTNVVTAALKGQRRKLYHLYIHTHSERPRSSLRDLEALAKTAGARVTHTGNTALLDKLSESRPHNGLVLEASALPALPVLSLGTPDPEAQSTPLTLAHQSAEEAAINGTATSLPPTASQSPRTSARHPFVLFLDGITDPGNVGNILRSAHFYGADAVAVASNTCAPLASAVVAKASAGACEAIPLLAVPRPSSFVHDSGRAGWRICAAVAPPQTHGRGGADGRQTRKHAGTAALARASPLADGPCILMLGAEGEGLRENLRSKAGLFVSIERGRRGGEAADVGVDSVNVAVAAGVLMEAFMRNADSAGRGKGVRAEESELGF